MKKFLLTNLCLLLFASIVMSQTVIRGPYLQKASSSSMTVKWRTDVPTQSVIKYGTSTGNLSFSATDLTLKTNHELELLSLNPETVYYYQLEDSYNVLAAAATDQYFKTHPNIGDTGNYKFWILGDCGTANNNQRNVRNAYYNYTGNNHTDGILFLGDNAYNSGHDHEYQNAVFENMYEDKLKNTVAWSTLGNHDGYTADSDSQTGPYYDIFTFPTSGESGGVASGTEAYYSFDYGNIHFICLESYETDRSTGGAMYNWCLNDIQNTTQEWIVAYWHHPPYTKGSHNSDTETELIQMRQNFLPMLESNGVDFVLSGHSHSYERSYFLNGHYGTANSFNANQHTVGATGSGTGRNINGNNNGAYVKNANGPDGGKGAVYITAGSSGKISGGSLNHQAMFYSVSRLGSCVMEVNGDQMDVKFIRETGAIDDYFTIQKNSINCTAGDPCNDGDPATSNDVYGANCDCIGSVDSLEVCLKINNDVDDVEQQSNGSIDAYSSDLELIRESNNQVIGLRFNNITVPQGATIDSAYIQFTTDETDSGGTNLTIRGMDMDNADPFTPTWYSISNRPATTAFTNWSPQPWTDVGESGPKQKTPDLGPIISEIVSRPGYQANNSIGFTISGSGTRTAESFDGDSNSAPTLCITYSSTVCPTIGQPCDDGDPCTMNDIQDESCNCAGTYMDSDFDGVCDASDQCAGAEPGLPCSDGDPCTVNDTVDNNCNCVGTYVDVDNDGTCDGNDQCPGFDNNLLFTPCDDGDPCTLNDTYNGSCNCVGVYTDSDNDGVCDTFDQCPGGPEPNTACNDNDPCTTNDRIDNNCNCVGTFQDSDNDGVCNVYDQCPNFDDNLIGTPCNDNNACTINDTYNNNCGCTGTYVDSDNDGVCDAQDQCPGGPEPNTSCNDGDPCTVNDRIDFNCNCVGTFQDSDNDGVCNAQDQCPSFDNNLIGSACDDGNPCSMNDVYTSNCNCEGTIQDSDNDGVCNAQDQCPGGPDPGQACDDGNPCTYDDEIDSNCNCVGIDDDDDNDGICNFQDQCPNLDDTLLGTPCNDNDPTTINDVYTTSICGCQGTTDPNSNPTTGTTCIRISTGFDDVEQNGNNQFVDRNSSDIELVNDGNAGNQIIGLRFQNIDVPQGATITEAYIQFTTDKVSVGTTNLTFVGENVDDSAPFASVGGNVSTRSLTNASVSWSPPNWNTVDQAGTRQRSPDLTSIVSAITNRAGYFMNNSMTFIVYGSGKRTAVAYEDDPSKAAELCITYESNACTVAQACDDGDPCTTGETYDINCNCTGGTNTCNTSKVNAKLLLQGFYDSATGTMRSNLKDSGLLPFNQPYNTAPWNYNGTESIASYPIDAVDWVLLMVRTSTGTVLDRKVGFIDKNGLLLDADGTQGITISNAMGNHISVHHKSHLAVMSSSAYTGTTYDFTVGASRAAGVQQLLLVSGKYMLHAGDFDGNGIINNSDFNDWKSQSAALNQYLPIDGDGNGIINAADYNLWILNRSKIGHSPLQY